MPRKPKLTGKKKANRPAKRKPSARQIVVLTSYYEIYVFEPDSIPAGTSEATLDLYTTSPIEETLSNFTSVVIKKEDGTAADVTAEFRPPQQGDLVQIRIFIGPEADGHHIVEITDGTSVKINTQNGKYFDIQ